MIKARHSEFYQWFFKLYFQLITNYHFYNVDYRLPRKIDDNKSVLLLCNHVSWWDGILLYQLNNRHLKKNFHVMMLEKELKSRKFLRGLGAYSIKRKSKSLFESLNYTKDLLKEPENMVLIFPQGEIEAINKPKPQFQKGLSYLLSEELDKVQIIFAYLQYSAGTKPRPSVSLRLELMDNQAYDFEAFKEKYLEFYKTNLKKSFEC